MQRIVFVVAALLLASDCRAVVLKQPERADQHRELASGLPFISIGEIGGGVAIAPEWVLTAGHVAQALVPGVSMITVRGTDYRVLEITMPDTFVAEPEKGRIHDDIALVRVDRSLPEEVIAIPGCKAPAPGDDVIFVGAGDHEDAKGQPLNSVPPTTPLAGPNRLFAITPVWLEIAVGAPDSPADAVMSAGGDSGGPLLRRHEKRWQVVGVSSHYAADDATNFQRDRFTRVDRHCDFLQAAVNAEPSEGIGTGGVSASELDVVNEWIAAYNGGVEAMLAFYDGPRSAIETSASSGDRYHALVDAWGAVSLLGAGAEPEPNSVLLAVETERAGRLEIAILLTPDKPPRMRGIATFD